MTKRTIPIVGTKSNLTWDEDTDAWVYFSGEPMRGDDPRAFYGLVPTLYRGIDKRAKAISGLPWAIMKGEKEVDTSYGYENKTGLVSNMNSLLWLIEAAMSLVGKAYLKREKNPAGYDKIRYLEPNSVTLDQLQAKQGKIIFHRNIDGVTYDYTNKEIIYLWQPDPLVEFGPPSVSCAGTAMNACGVLVNLDEFARNYFGRGAIKAMLFAMEGAPKGEAERFETWWNKFISGIRNAFRTKVINASKVEPVIVGEGIKELENVTLSQEKREEIAIALDIPMSLLFADAANYATAQQDKKNWITDFVTPEANFIASTLNEQVYKPLGLRLEFYPEDLSIMQQDENERAASLNQLVTALSSPQEFLWASNILGYDIDEDVLAEIEKSVKDKEVAAEEMRDNFANAAAEPEPTTDEEEMPMNEPLNEAQVKELTIWQRKCLNALKRGEAADSIAFVPVSITAQIYDAIIAGLKSADCPDKVKEVFKQATIAGNEKPAEVEPLKDSGLFALASELRRASDLLEREG